MKKNVGTVDAVIRIALGVIIIIAGFYYKSWWGLLALVPLLTAWFSFCPIYSLFGINSCKRTIKVN